ncbi:PstS family phosphate ABC transporter substrate-binding protein [Gynurincola endophyticus]|jgi:phosphate transport system substrate-binding protein|uniref:PstS family phosphate ABC transporter substrate-binding protein n=1 Tax=Gynurincola endophyticus TaxID=2479004 RepID=UPI0013154BAD|nr:substrate-binding domain-containing protein [Gynurincola endophyticus]
MKHSFWKHICYAIMAVTMLVSCAGDTANQQPRESATRGTINISVDESFQLVIEQQIFAFEGLYPNAKINVTYKPEAECLKDLNNDSIRMVIVTRGLSDDEVKQFEQRKRYRPSFGIVAYDALAVILNKKSKDTLFKMSDIKAMLEKKSEYPYKVVVDGKVATSTVRYLQDSVLKSKDLGTNIEGAENSLGVIDYVSKNQDAIGILGVSWVGNKDDSTQLSFLEKVKIAKLECRNCEGTYVDPVQYNIAHVRYPMFRPLYYILKENWNGLGHGFANFLSYEKGQKVFYRSYLLPGKMSFTVRTVEISE